MQSRWHIYEIPAKAGRKRGQMKKKFWAGLATGLVILGVLRNANATSILTLTGGSYFGDGISSFELTATLSDTGTFKVVSWYVNGHAASNIDYIDSDPTYIQVLTDNGPPFLGAGISLLHVQQHVGYFYGLDSGLQPAGANNSFNIYFRDPTGSLTFANLTNYTSSIGWAACDYRFELNGRYGEVGTKISISDEDDCTPVPEPATMFLMGTGLAGLVGVSRTARCSASVGNGRSARLT